MDDCDIKNQSIASGSPLNEYIQIFLQIFMERINKQDGGLQKALRDVNGMADYIYSDGIQTWRETQTESPRI